METDTVVPVFVKSTKSMETQIDVYHFPASPPSRSVVLLANYLGLPINVNIINIMSGEQMRPEYLKMNPTHTVPTLDDNGFFLWESRAVLQYLVDQYDKDDNLSTKDAKHAAMVNQRLYFGATTLFPKIVGYFAPVVRGGEQPNNEKKASVEEALKVLDTLLEDKKWATGSRMTIADFALVTDVSTAEAVQIDITPYPNVYAWYERIKKELAPFGYEEINQKGADMIAEAFKSKIQ